MKCNLCPRKCNTDRSAQNGFCNVPDKVYIARADLHMWEEPCISGKEGSGTIFFSGCNMKCVFCQNREISRDAYGKEISVEELAKIMLGLEEKRANNINLVTPTHYIPQIVDAIKLAKKAGLTIPIVYNTSSYEDPNSLKMLDGLIDIYLPDFKYYDDEPATKYSNARGYRQIATAAIDEMLRQCPAAEFDERKIMQKGIIVRHMILPGYCNDSKKILKLLNERYGDNIYISIMNQYTPVGIPDKYKELNRKITKREYDKVCDYAIDIGIENGFIQEGGTAKESFIPPFGDV